MRRPDSDQPESLTRVREARRDFTPAERRLWSKLRSRQLQGHKFRRQVWLGPFVADFFCAEAGWVVEVDGETHASQLNMTSAELPGSAVMVFGLCGLQTPT